MLSLNDVKALERKLVGRDNPNVIQGIKDALMDTDNTLTYETDSAAQIMYRIGQVRADRWKDKDATTARRINLYKTR